MPTGIIELKIGACLNAPTRKMVKWLNEAAKDCCRARNAAVRHWMRWREDNPTWKPAQRRTRKGLKFSPSGKPVMESAFASQDEENAMYYAARDAARGLSSNIASHCRGDVVKYLTGRMPYDYDGPHKFRWQAILDYAINPPSFHSPMINVPTANAAICYCGAISRGNSSDLRERGKSSCVLTFPLFSKESGRGTTGLIVRLEVRQLSAGNRLLIRRIANGELRMADSKIVFKDKKKGGWYFQLAYNVPAVDHGLDKSRTATLEIAAKGSRKPFILRFPDGRIWSMGDGEMLASVHRRISARRKAIRYRSSFGSGRGHGKQGFYRAIKPIGRAFMDAQDLFQKNLVADVVKACAKNDCGTLVYREPTMPLRELSWFAEHDVPFNWTQLADRLAFKAECNSIVHDRKTHRVRIGVGEWRGESDGGGAVSVPKNAGKTSGETERNGTARKTARKVKS